LRTSRILAALAATTIVLAAHAADVSKESELAKQYQADIDVLASDAMEGRGIGTKGIGKAADFIEGRLKTIGLKPAFGGSYRQGFRIKTGVEQIDGNRLDGVAAGDWVPLGFSSSRAFSGELAFVGYGISAPPVGYDDLAGVDLHGKVVLMLRYEPQERDDASPFDGRKPSRWSAMRYRVHQARERGAVAVVFVTGPLQDEEKDKLPPLRNDGPESPAGIPVLQVKLSVAQKWLESSKVNLKAFQEAVDRDLIPRSVGHTGVTVSGATALQETYADAQNIAGIFPGAGPLAGEAIVLGAHYDHLGYGGQGSMRPNVTAIHNGADDNASGDVAVMQAAALVKEALKSSTNRRSLIVVLFSGEEVGLAGSSAFVAKPPVPMTSVRAMVNLDMVGRLRDNRFAALGSDTAPEWAPRLKEIAATLGLDVNPRGDGYGPSDQTSFYSQHIPVIHLFTGTHEQYHTPDDKPATINAVGGAKMSEFTAALVGDLTAGRLNPTYVRAQSAPAMEGDSRGYGAYLGTVPDYTAMETTKGGVLLADVRPGGPADLAGIKGGDRIVEMAGTRIDNLYDMTFALQDHKPGETITVIVIRKEERVPLRATLGSRSAMPAPKPAATPAAVPATPPAPPPPPMPPNPHTGSPEAAADSKFVLPPFYERRPGADFKIGAGKPVETFAGEEKHLKELRQLSFGGTNAEAYFSPDGKQLIFQATPPGTGCDQQFVMDLATGDIKRVSDGKGRTTCGYFRYPHGDRIVYASTEGAGADCPPRPDRSKGYTWGVYDSFKIYSAKPDGSDKKLLIGGPGYNAEATWCHHGGKFVFTSDRDGDLDLYEMDEAGQTRRLTNTVGYDGGAFYSADCSEIVWRASRPTGAALDEYKQLLAQHIVKPTEMELFVMKSDGSNPRQLTRNGAANFAPFFHPDGNHILYSSNAGAKDFSGFDIVMIDKKDGDPEKITTAPGFDGFPMFSPDGRYLVFASNRTNPEGHETNLFIGRWVE
jgi:TolB protein